MAEQLMEAALASPAPGHLWVLDGNDRAIAFCRKVGFGPDGAVKHDARLDATEIRVVRSDRTG